MNKDLKLPKTYKTLLMLALVFGPFIWLAFTEDGQRRTDLALMFLFGKPEFNAALGAFHTGLDEAKLRALFPNLELQCADGANPFGDRLCGAEIGSFNQIPATSLALFFAGEQLRAAKVVYRRGYHRLVGDWLQRQTAGRESGLESVPAAAASDAVTAEPVVDGVLFLRRGALEADDEPALLWLSRAAIDDRH